MKRAPVISFVVIEYHCLEEMGACTESIRHAAGDLPYEVVISSNSGYGKGERERLAGQFPGTKWVFNEANLGFGVAMNRGMAAASGEILALLNPDVRIHGGLTGAVEYLRENRGVGLLGPRVVDSAGNLQDSCRRFMTPWELLVRQSRRVFLRQEVVLMKSFDYGAVRDVDWVIGAFMLVPRGALEAVGGFDEGFFLYVEDMDWCKRFWDAGRSVVYYPSLEVEFKGDRKSVRPLLSGGIGFRYSLHHVRSYLRFLGKHGVCSPGRSRTRNPPG